MPMARLSIWLLRSGSAIQDSEALCCSLEAVSCVRVIGPVTG